MDAVCSSFRSKWWGGGGGVSFSVVVVGDSLPERDKVLKRGSFCGSSRTLVKFSAQEKKRSTRIMWMFVVSDPIVYSRNSIFVQSVRSPFSLSFQFRICIFKCPSNRFTQTSLERSFLNTTKNGQGRLALCKVLQVPFSPLP